MIIFRTNIRTRFRYIGYIDVFFFSSSRRHTRFSRDWSSDVCSSDLGLETGPYTMYLAGIYIGIHALAGILIGLFAARLPDLLPKISHQPQAAVIQKTTEHFQVAAKTNKKKKFRVQVSLVVIWAVLLAVFLQSYFGIGPVVLPSHKLFHIIIRSVLIVAVWYFVVSPLLMRLLKKWLAGKKNAYK